jgi:hypothetical protein
MHALGMGLGVGQRQGRAPGTAEQHPFVDAQVFADALEVGDQVPGGVVFQAGVGRRAAAAALVEGDDAVQVRVEIAAALGVATGAGPPWMNTTGKPSGEPLSSTYSVWASSTARSCRA